VLVWELHRTPFQSSYAPSTPLLFLYRFFTMSFFLLQVSNGICCHADF
jgi:hypothetical protein